MTSSSARVDDDEPTFVVYFASLIMILSGSLSALYGLTAILNDEVVTVGGRGVIVWDFTTWGWIVLIAGALVALVGVGLFLGKGAARVLAVIVVMLHALSYFGTISAFPLWALFMIGLDVLIIYHLIARWPATR